MRLVYFIFISLPLCAQPELAREIFKQLIEINTTDSIGGVTAKMWPERTLVRSFYEAHEFMYGLVAELGK